MERVVANEIGGPNSLLGYILMWNMLKERHSIYITRAFVGTILKKIDLEGVEAGLRHRLKIRKYRSAGPNFCWHLDVCEKLKPYGFSIHGCIDGYSRKMLWLCSLKSNKDPLGR